MNAVMRVEPNMAVETTTELFNSFLSRGVNESRLLGMSGINLTELHKADLRFPVSKHLDLWHAGKKLTKTTAMGVQVGAASNPYNRGIVGLVFSASQNLQQAIENKIRYTKILADHVNVEFQINSKLFSITYSILEGYFDRSEVERVLAGFLNWVRIFINARINPLYMTVQYSEPGEISEYRKNFQCRVLFDQLNNSITFPVEILSTVNRQYNEYLYQVLTAHAENILEKIDVKPSFHDEIRSMIAGRLTHGSFSFDEIAATLKQSKRTLARRLSSESTSYQKILDEVRKEMAISYLNQRQCRHQTIPYLLGYSDNRSFLRAFKRWTGSTLKKYCI